MLGVILSRLLITPEFLGRTYTDQMNFAKKVDAIKNALDLHKKRYSFQIFSEELATNTKAILDEITSIRSFRNYFSHYCWMRSNDNEIFGTPISGKLPHSKEKNDESITLSNSKLQHLYKKAFEIVDKLQKLVDNLPEIDESLKMAKKKFI